MSTSIIALQLLNRAGKLVFKVVKEIMNQVGLKANKRKQRKYSSYRGIVGRLYL